MSDVREGAARESAQPPGGGSAGRRGRSDAAAPSWSVRESGGPSTIL